MIKTWYCWNGNCPFQCKTTISAPLQEYIDTDKTGTVDIPCQMKIQEPIWKETSPAEGLEADSEAVERTGDSMPLTEFWKAIEYIIGDVTGESEPLPVLINDEIMHIEAFKTHTGHVIVLTEKDEREAV